MCSLQRTPNWKSQTKKWRRCFTSLYGGFFSPLSASREKRKLIICDWINVTSFAWGKKIDTETVHCLAAIVSFSFSPLIKLRGGFTKKSIKFRLPHNGRILLLVFSFSYCRSYLLSWEAIQTFESLVTKMYSLDWSFYRICCCCCIYEKFQLFPLRGLSSFTQDFGEKKKKTFPQWSNFPEKTTQ